MPTIYALDVTGVLPANKITLEDQTLSSINYKDFAFLIPQFAPFYSNSLVMTYTDQNGNTRPMVEGVDFLFAMPYIGASRATAMNIYGAVSFLDLTLNGTVRFVQYQTLGGNHTIDAATMTQLLVDLIANPRVTSWEQVTSQPEVFPPAPHEWDLIDMVGMSAVDESLRKIAEAILKSISNGQNEHFTNYSNPHETDKNDIGLDLVENYPPATASQCIAGTNAAAYVTPVGLSAALSASIGNLATNLQSLSTSVNNYGPRLSTAESNIIGLRTDLTSLSTSTSTNRVSISTALSTTIVNLNIADTNLQNGINSLQSQITAANVSINNTYNYAVSVETARQTSVNSLQGQINNLSGYVESVNNARISEINRVDGRINAIYTGDYIQWFLNNTSCAALIAKLQACGYYGGGVGPGGPGPVE